MNRARPLDEETVCKIPVPTDALLSSNSFQVEELHAIEAENDNTVLIIEAVVAAIFMFSTCLCGCWIACKRSSDYEDELQKV